MELECSNYQPKLALLSYVGVACAPLTIIGFADRNQTADARGMKFVCSNSQEPAHYNEGGFKLIQILYSVYSFCASN